MTVDELNKIDLGSSVKYGPYSNVKITMFDDKYVTLVDNKGQKKNIYTDLFLKHGELIEANK